MTENEFEIHLPSPLHIAVRHGIVDVYGWEKGRIQKTFEIAMYEWCLNNKDKFSKISLEALESYEKERNLLINQK